MSVDNSVAPTGVAADADASRTPFSVPDELLARYEVRVVSAPEGGERRVGMFLPGDRVNPALEIGDERIVARSQDPETVARLVKLAQHNGWEKIDVEGSAEFRKAVWTAAAREGLAVSGYEPTFAERERVEALRRDATARPSTPARDDADDATFPGQAAGAGLSDGDRRLLLTLSRHTEDRKALYATLDPAMDAFQREVQYERIDLNRQALDGALERALESPTLEKAFAQAGYEPAALRDLAKRGEWDGEVSDAIYLVRSGLDRSAMNAPGAGETPARPGNAARDDLSAAGSIVPPGQAREIEAGGIQQERRREEAADRHHESEELAELFLHGAAETIAADPRLANAVRAQGAMEQHIAEVFPNDVWQTTTANLESRQMISDVLRRGLDVSVREPAAVRQIEPAHSLEMER